MEMQEPLTTLKFILPTLPAGKGKAKVGSWPVLVPKCSHQNLDGNEALCLQQVLLMVFSPFNHVNS